MWICEAITISVMADRLQLQCHWLWMDAEEAVLRSIIRRRIWTYERALWLTYECWPWDGKRGLKTPCCTWFVVSGHVLLMMINYITSIKWQLLFNALFSTLLSQAKSTLSDSILNYWHSLFLSYLIRITLISFLIGNLYLWFQIRIDYHFSLQKL